MKVQELVGRRLQMARESTGLTQEQLGEMMASFLGKAWPRQQVSLAESGKREFTAVEMFALCMALTRPASYFFLPMQVEDVIEAPQGGTNVNGDWATGVQLTGGGQPWDAAQPIVAGIVQPLPEQLRRIESLAKQVREQVSIIRRTVTDAKKADVDEFA